jgi:DNA-binding GntR family transcriptional regulator
MRQADVQSDYLFDYLLAALCFSFNGQGEPNSAEANVTTVLEKLSPTDIDLGYGLAKQMTRTHSAKEHFEYDRRFWDIIFEKAQRPILWEAFRQLDDRLTRYNPLVLKLFPDSATRPRQREVLIEFLRKGEVDEAVRAFKKLYLEVVHRIIDHLKTEDVG